MKTTRIDRHDPSIDREWLYTLLGAMGGGLLLISIQALTRENFLSTLFGGIFLAASVASAGGFLGFLFGIPRAKQTHVHSLDGDVQSREYLENTNLEQISDWITKIIVGLTLVQFDEIRIFTISIGARYATVFTREEFDSTTAQAIAIAVVLYFFLLSFLFSYLWTRIYMESLLKRQHALLESEIIAIVDTREKKKSTQDAFILELVEEYLNSSSDTSHVKFATIQKDVEQASLLARSTIFRAAQAVRRENWKEPAKRALVERTIPIFRGLIAAAPDRYHRNYGQLAYALIRQPVPDWKEAKRILEKAIELRGPEKDAGYSYYEFHLALALINTSKEFRTNVSSPEPEKTRITELLTIGKKAVQLSEEDSIVNWSELNEYSIS